MRNALKGVLPDEIRKRRSKTSFDSSIIGALHARDRHLVEALRHSRQLGEYVNIEALMEIWATLQPGDTHLPPYFPILQATRLNEWLCKQPVVYQNSDASFSTASDSRIVV